MPAQPAPFPKPNPDPGEETHDNGKHLQREGSLFLLNCFWLHKILRSD